MEISTSEFIPLAWASPIIAVDTEGTDIKKTDIRDGSGHGYGISLACRPVNGQGLFSTYVPVRHTEGNVDAETFTQIKYLIENHPQRVGHNILKYDGVSLPTMGISLPHPSTGLPTYDTMLMLHWLYEEFTYNRFPLDWCVKYFLKRDVGKVKNVEWDFWMTAVGWHPDFPARVMASYACPDAEITLDLFDYVRPRFVREFGEF